MKQKSKIWYSFYGGKSEDDDVWYYPEEDFDWIPMLESNFDTIKEEMLAYVNKKEKMSSYFVEGIAKGPRGANSWNAISFFFWGLKFHKNSKQCPKSVEIFKKIPNLVSMSISVFDPQTELAPHRGDSNTFYRAHLPLSIPGKLPECGFKVGYEERSWEEGKVFVFNDAARHLAWNRTDTRRLIVMFDFIKPEFSYMKYRICASVLGGIAVQYLGQKLKFVANGSNFIRKTTFELMRLVALIYRPLQRSIGMFY